MKNHVEVQFCPYIHSTANRMCNAGDATREIISIVLEEKKYTAHCIDNTFSCQKFSFLSGPPLYNIFCKDGCISKISETHQNICRHFPTVFVFYHIYTIIRKRTHFVPAPIENRTVICKDKDKTKSLPNLSLCWYCK